MRRTSWLVIILLLAIGSDSRAQIWSGILQSGKAIDWSSNGIPGGIPSGSWMQSGSTILASQSPCNNGSGDCTSTIQTALNSCGSAHYVLLGAGTFKIASNLTIPSACVLRGQGADQTILSCSTSAGTGCVILGAALDAYPGTSNDTAITGGLSAGSTSITVANASAITAGSTLLSISELNSLSNGVNIVGSEGPCTWCDGNYNGIRADGQTVLVTAKSGTTLTISPGLYWTYGSTLPNWAGGTKYFLDTFITHGGHYYKETASPGSPYNCTSGGAAPAFSTSGGSVGDGGCSWLDMGTGTTTQPIATPYTPAAADAGIESLQLYIVNGGTGTQVGPNVVMNQCQYCWVHGIEDNYTDADHVFVNWSYFGEISDNYFSNAILHTSGTYDSCVQLALKTSGFLVQNNIFERLHYSLILEGGTSGNVIAYNYMEGNFDQNSNSAVMASVNTHGSHPMFNLVEGNVGMQVYYDSVWGTSSHNTAYRNWLQGSSALCSPLNAGRSAVTCNTKTYPFQASRAVQASYLATNTNYVGNVIGSASQSALTCWSTCGFADSIQWSSNRSYDSAAYGWSFGYGELSDDDSWALDNSASYANAFQHGNYGNISGQIVWQSGVTHTLPASFYLPAKPSWWGSLAYPAIGPDVTGGPGPGGHAALIPAQNCYLNQMGGTDGGAGSPRTFNATTCYGGQSGGGPPAPTGMQAVVH